MGRSKNSKYAACGCCIDYSYNFHDNAKGSQYRFGDDEDPRYKKQSRRKRKTCKRAKDGKHDFTEKYSAYKWVYKYDPEKKRFMSVNTEVTLFKCSHCGKPAAVRYYF